jgi:hypothetical protein
MRAGPDTAAADFAATFEAYGPTETAIRLGCSVRAVHDRRRRAEAVLGRDIISPTLAGGHLRAEAEHPQRHHLTVEDGVVLVFSDAHYWPGRISTAHRALVRACKDFGKELRAVICNGDAFDGASISRFPVQQWLDADKRPSVKDELDACRDRLTEIELASRKGAEFIWPLGNHDQRYEAKLAASVPEFSKCSGFHLKDHFPRWVPTWSCWINDDVVVKHRHRGGLHSATQSPLWSGKTMVCGHLHSLQVRPLTDYSGTRFGVDTGTLSDPEGPQFDYCEDNPKNWRSGFVVLTFRGGRLMWPEVCHVIGEGQVEFRGKVYEV